MYNFSNCIELPTTYGGSEKKKKIIYNDTIYLVKFPDPIRDSKNPLSYMNNQFSEYVGCKIFESVHIPVQKTALGFYDEPSGKRKVVVACEDFTVNGHELCEFSQFGISLTDSNKKFKSSIEDVYDIIANSSLITEKESIEKSFWDMFIIDALIGNKDRHLDNWGLMHKDGKMVFSPVYDCGSSLHALLSDEQCEKYLHDPVAAKNEFYNIYSCYTYAGKKIHYPSFFKDPIDPLTESLKRIAPKINLSVIENIIYSTPYMSNSRKDFLFQSVKYRKENVIDKAFARVHNNLDSKIDIASSKKNIKCNNSVERVYDKMNHERC